MLPSPPPPPPPSQVSRLARSHLQQLQHREAGFRAWRSLMRQLVESGLLVGVEASRGEIRKKRVSEGRGAGREAEKSSMRL